MPDANLNALWGRVLGEALLAAGCRHVVASPGSRNCPLLFACDRLYGDRLVMHTDERGAAFHALGLAKALGEPVAVCVTSGTAAANLLPAVCEADAAGIPLILLTADRPTELQGCGAPQTMHQPGLFGVFAEALEIGEASEATAETMHEQVRVAVSRARRPLHLNLPLRDPLPPLPEERGAPAPPGPRGSCPARSDVSAPHGLIVAGPAESVAPALVARLAEATGFPVLADACSGLRRPAIANLVACPDALYARPPADPDVILRIGPPPLTRAGYEWLGRQACPQIVLGGARDDDFIRSASERIVDPGAAAVERLIARLGRADEAWRALWQNIAPTGAGWNATSATAAVCAADGFPLLWLASSMAVRDANLLLAPRSTPQRVLCNRGLNGIDGTIASFCGASAALGRGLCLIGDLACLHDLNSLALAGRARGAVVVLNNGGGAIFDALPVSRVPGYRRLVRTDHDLDLAGAAALFRLPYRRCDNLVALTGALAEAVVHDELLLVECDLRGSDGIAAHRAALAAVCAP
jgi:2-succinyl-5-enolpyruvyl-6-hydroxy-3-cyclohexene-1-carboxylate synthase